MRPSNMRQVECAERPLPSANGPERQVSWEPAQLVGSPYSAVRR